MAPPMIHPDVINAIKTLWSQDKARTAVAVWKHFGPDLISLRKVQLIVAEAKKDTLGQAAQEIAESYDTTETERQWLTAEQFRKRNPRLGKNLIYNAVRDGQLPSIRLGGKILIPSDALDKLLEAWMPSGDKYDTDIERDIPNQCSCRHKDVSETR